MTLYRIRCHRGPITTVETIVEVWADGIADAYEQCRARGYTPIGMEALGRGWQ